MTRQIVETKNFTNEIDSFIKKRKLLAEDFETFKKFLSKNPEIGDIITGTGGLRKIRLKSSAKGKSGGFRVCYFDDKLANSIFLIWIYAKNNKEDIDAQDKKIFKAIINRIKIQNYN